MIDPALTLEGDGFNSRQHENSPPAHDRNHAGSEKHKRFGALGGGGRASRTLRGSGNASFTAIGYLAGMSTRPEILAPSGLTLALALCLSLAIGDAAFANSNNSPPHGAAEADDTRHRSLTSSDSYLPLPPLMATVQSGHRARGNLQIEAGLEVEDARLRRRVEQAMPRLRNAYVTALSIYTGVNYRFGDVPDADRISQLLQDATDMTMGTEGARVLIGMVIINTQ